MNSKFSYNWDRYEFWSYLIPGFLTLFLIWYFLRHFWQIKWVEIHLGVNQNLLEGTLWFLVVLFVAYVIGLLLQAIFNWIITLEKWLLEKVPLIKWLLKKFGYVPAYLIYPIDEANKEDEKYYIPFTEKLIKKVGAIYKFKTKNKGKIEKCIYYLCYHSSVVQENPLVPIYLAKTNMLRNLTVVAFLSFGLYLLCSSSLTNEWERVLGISLSLVLIPVFWLEGNKVAKSLYQTVFLTWWEYYGNKYKDKTE